MNLLTDHQKGLAAVLVSAVIWSTGGLFIKLMTFNAFEISFYRSIFAALVFIILFKQNVFKINRLSFFAALSYAAILILFVIATKLTTAANAIFLQYTAPIYVLILEPLLLKTKYERINIITVFLCLTGMVLFFVGELTPGHIEGNFIALLSGISFAAFMLLMRKNGKEYQSGSIFWGNIFVCIICIPFLFGETDYNFQNFWMVSFLGIFQIGLAYAIFTYGMKRVLAIEASLIAMVEPVLNPVWVFIWYGEQPMLNSIFGGIIILTAIMIRTIIVERRRMKLRI